MIAETITRWVASGELDEPIELISRCISGKPKEVAPEVTVERLTEDCRNEIIHMLLQNYLIRFCTCRKRRHDESELTSHAFVSYLREQSRKAYFQANVWSLLEIMATYDEEK